MAEAEHPQIKKLLEPDPDDKSDAAKLWTILKRMSSGQQLKLASLCVPISGAAYFLGWHSRGTPDAVPASPPALSALEETKRVSFDRWAKLPGVYVNAIDEGVVRPALGRAKPASHKTSMSYDVRLRALRATANLGLPADRYYRIETDVAFRRVDPVPTSEIRIVAVTDQAQLRWWIEDESVLSRELISIDSRDHDWLARLRARVEALPQHLKFDEVKKLFFVDLRIGSETLRPKDVRWEADGIVFQYDNPRSRVTTEVDYKIHYESIQARSQKSFAFYIAELTHGYVATLDLPDDVLSPAFFSAMLDTSPDPLECVALGRDGRTIKIDTRGRWCFPGTGVVAYWD